MVRFLKPPAGNFRPTLDLVLEMKRLGQPLSTCAHFSDAVCGRQRGREMTEGPRAGTPTIHMLMLPKERRSTVIHGDVFAKLWRTCCSFLCLRLCLFLCVACGVFGVVWLDEWRRREGARWRGNGREGLRERYGGQQRQMKAPASMARRLTTRECRWDRKGRLYPHEGRVSRREILHAS
jgi:hypothetical protein